MSCCLELSLLPSPVLALVERRDDGYVKRFGVRKGAQIWEDPYLSGRWFDPWRYLNDVDKPLADRVHGLLEKYGDCIGISISPGDEGLIFVVSFLTQNTDYYSNVLRWTRALFERSERLEDIAAEAPKVGGSYQLRRLPRAVERYLSLKPKTRLDLLAIEGVGPKTADLYLLYTGDTSAAPVDKHFARSASDLGLAGEPPNPRYCRRYSCAECPLAGRCIRGQAQFRLGRLAGWVQTVVWLSSNRRTAQTLRGCSGGR